MVNGTLSSGTDTVNNQSMIVYSTDYLVGSSLTIVAVDSQDNEVDVITDSQVTIYAVLKDNTDTVIEGATVYFDVNGTISHDTTDSSGEAEGPTINTGGDDEVYYIRAYYLGTTGLAGSTAFKIMPNNYAHTPDNLKLYGTKTIIQSGDTLKLFGAVTDEGNEPVQGVRVEFYIDDGE